MAEHRRVNRLPSIRSRAIETVSVPAVLACRVELIEHRVVLKDSKLTKKETLFLNLSIV